MTKQQQPLKAIHHLEAQVLVAKSRATTAMIACKGLQFDEKKIPWKALRWQ